MILLQMTLGDLHAYVTAVQSLDKTDPMPMHYTLHVHDLPTGRHASMALETEMDAVRAFSCLVWADEPPKEWEADVKKLKAALPGWCLP